MQQLFNRRRGLLSADEGRGLFGFGNSTLAGFMNPARERPIMGPPGRGLRAFNQPEPMNATEPPEAEDRQPSPREVFDYDGTLREMERNNRDSSLADAFARAMAFQEGDYGRAAEITGRMAGRARDTKNQALKWKREDWVDQRQADLQAMHPTTIGRARIVYNPITDETREVYRGPEDFELYAKHLGIEPGSDEYFRAVEDYVLKSSGPSAHSRDLELDDHRTGNDVKLEGVRQGNRVSLEGMRQGNREKLRQMPLPPRASVAGAPRKGGSVPTAIDPRTGRKVELRNGQWVPVR